MSDLTEVNELLRSQVTGQERIYCGVVGDPDPNRFMTIETLLDASPKTLTVGNGMQFATIADAVAYITSLSPAPITVQSGDTCTCSAGTFYVEVDGVANLFGTRYMDRFLWLNITGNPRSMLSFSPTGDNATLSLSTSVPNAVSGAAFTVESMPRFTIELHGDIPHLITTDVQLPEHCEIYLQGRAGTLAAVSIEGAGVLRMMDEGAFFERGINWGFSKNGLCITNHATPNNNLRGLALVMQGGSINTPPSTPAGTGVITTSLMDVRCNIVGFDKLVGSVTPNPNTVRVFRITAATFDIKIEFDSDQTAPDRFIPFEISTYADIQRAGNRKTLTMVSSVGASQVNIASRSSIDDSFTVSATQLLSMSVFVHGTASIVFEAVRGIVVLANRARGGNLEGALDNTIFAIEPFNDGVVPGATPVLFGNPLGREGSEFAPDGTSPLIPTAATHRITALVPASYTAVPNIDCSALPIGTEFFISVTGSSSQNVTFKDVSVQADSSVYTFSGLTTPGNLVIQPGEMVGFKVFVSGNNTIAVQSTPVLQYQTAVP